MPYCKCGLELIPGETWGAGDERKGIKICRACHTNRARKWRQEHPGQARATRKRLKTLPNGRFHLAKGRAKAKGIAWLLTLEEYTALVGRPCTYCDAPLVGSCTGLDRMDRRCGFGVFNVVPACPECIRVRGKVYTPGQMMVLGTMIKGFRC